MSINVVRGMRALVWLVLLLSAVAQAQTSDTVRLEAVVRQVVAHNDRLAAMSYMERAAQEKIGPAGAWDDPMLMLGVVNLPTTLKFDQDMMTMKMIGLSQSIPYAGQKGLEAKAAKAEAAVSRDETESMRRELVAAATTAYADLYYRRRAVTQLAAQYELLDQVVASTRAKLTVDLGTQDELLAAQAEQWRLQAQLVMAESDAEESGYRLNALRGVEPMIQIGVLAEPVWDSLPATAEPWLATARESYPPLAKLRHQGESYGFSAQAASRMSWPMLGLSAEYGVRGSADMPLDNMLSFQATFSLPLFSGRAQRKMARSMTAMQESSTAEEAQVWRDVQADVSALYLHALHYHDNVRLYEERIIPASEDAFRGALAGYTTNRTPLTNVLNYALAIARDRLTLLEQKRSLARTMAEAGKYLYSPEQNPTGTIGER
jgi:outer membrane protein, heavy metal efflux system